MLLGKGVQTGPFQPTHTHTHTHSQVRLNRNREFDPDEDHSCVSCESVCKCVLALLHGTHFQEEFTPEEVSC